MNKQIDLPWPYFMMEYLFDTTRAVVNLIFGGVLERYPRIRFILPHAGGLVGQSAFVEFGEDTDAYRANGTVRAAG